MALRPVNVSGAKVCVSIEVSDLARTGRPARAGVCSRIVAADDILQFLIQPVPQYTRLTDPGRRILCVLRRPRFVRRDALSCPDLFTPALQRLALSNSRPSVILPESSQRQLDSFFTQQAAYLLVSVSLLLQREDFRQQGRNRFEHAGPPRRRPGSRLPQKLPHALQISIFHYPVLLGRLPGAHRSLYQYSHLIQPRLHLHYSLYSCRFPLTLRHSSIRAIGEIQSDFAGFSGHSTHLRCRQLATTRLEHQSLLAFAWPGNAGR